MLQCKWGRVLFFFWRAIFALGCRSQLPFVCDDQSPGLQPNHTSSHKAKKQARRICWACSKQCQFHPHCKSEMLSDCFHFAFEKKKEKLVNEASFKFPRTINLCWVKFKLNRFSTVFKLINKFYTLDIFELDCSGSSSPPTG